MKSRAKRLSFLVIAVLLITCGVGFVSCTHFEKNYAPTAVGVVEVKALPAARVIETMTTDYHQQSDPMFMRLFNYIKANDIAMTVPVEGELKPGVMRFFVEEKLAARQLKDSAEVKVRVLPARKVVACGARGGYGKVDTDRVIEKLLAWLKAHPEIKTRGEPYVVFWDGPFIPPMLRRMEVHVLVD